MHLFWPGPTTCGICYPTRDWTQVPCTEHTESYHWIPGKLLDLHFSFILLLTSSVTLGKIFSFTEWFFIPSVEMVLKISSLLDKWELREKYVPKCLEIKSRRSCEEIGRIAASKKTWEEERKVCINTKGIIPRPSIRTDSKWQLNKCLSCIHALFTHLFNKCEFPMAAMNP